jgi:hypothetical protein
MVARISMRKNMALRLPLRWREGGAPGARRA